MRRQRPTENGQLNFLQCILSARPINGLFRAPDVQSVERPPIRGLISLDIKPSRRGTEGEEGIDSACNMRAPSPFPRSLPVAGRRARAAVLISGRRSFARSISRVTLRLLIRTVDRTAKRRRAESLRGRREETRREEAGRDGRTRTEHEGGISGGRTSERPAGGAWRGSVNDKRACLASRTASGGLVPPPSVGQLLLLLLRPAAVAAGPPVQFPVLISAAVHATAALQYERCRKVT